MSIYTEYFLRSVSTEYEYETIEISHPAFTSTKRFVRNAPDGLTAVTEEGISRDFAYFPLQIDKANVTSSLDQKITIQLGDLGMLVPDELDRVGTQNKFNIKPICKYRTFKNTDLGKPLLGPVVLEIINFTMTADGCGFDAQAPSLNANRTGEVYSVGRFPMLRAFL